MVSPRKLLRTDDRIIWNNWQPGHRYAGVRWFCIQFSDRMHEVLNGVSLLSNESQHDFDIIVKKYKEVGKKSN